MKIAHIMVGLPGSGKSTAVGHKLSMFAEPPVVVSSDNYIEQFAEEQGKTYTEVFPEYVSEASEMARRDFFQAIKEEKTIIVDRTNLNVKSRREWLAPLLAAGYTVYAEVMEEPVNLQKRLDGRPGKVIPPGILASMKRNYVRPSVAEGFHRITYYG